MLPVVPVSEAMLSLSGASKAANQSLPSSVSVGSPRMHVQRWLSGLRVLVVGSGLWNLHFNPHPRGMTVGPGTTL